MSNSRPPAKPWLAVALLALACTSQPPPTTHYYLLNSGAGAELPTTASASAELDIGIRPFRVDPPFDQDRIVFRVGEGSPEIGFYDYHRWAAPMTLMLPEVVASAYRELPGVRMIEPVVPDRTYSHYLSGRLHSLVEVDLPEGQRIEARFELSLSDAAGVEIWSAVQSRDATLTTDSVERIVVEMRSVIEAALDQAYPSLYTRLVLLLDSADPSSD